MHIEMNIAATRRARLMPAWTTRGGLPGSGRPAIANDGALSTRELRRIVRDMLD